MFDIKVSIAGITGKVGRLLAIELLEKPNIIIHGICRDPSKVPSSIASHPNVKRFQASSSEAEKIRSAVRDTSVCVCCYLGDDSVMLDGQKTLIDVCVAEGVSRYVASDWSFDTRSLRLGDVAMKDFQLHVSAYLKEKSQQIQAVHVLNGAFMEVMFSSFIGIYDENSQVLETWGSGDEKWEVTTIADAAKYTAEIIANPESVGYFKGVY